MASTPPRPSPAAKARLAHLRHYANLSYITSHQSVTSNDPTVRLPRQDAAAQEAHEEAVRKESELLKGKIRQERELLSKLPHPRSSSSKPQTSHAHLNDLLTEQHLYSQKLSTSPPPPVQTFIPSPTSPLNPLLLHQFLTSSLTTLSTLTIPSSRKDLSCINSEILAEQKSLKTTLLLTTSLRNRIASLENELHSSGVEEDQDQNMDRDEEIVHTITQSLEKSYSVYAATQRKFLRELSKFINTYLAKLLAAESLGGPVVGDDLNIEVDSGVRFDRSGKLRRVDKEKGQQTIHDMFSSRKGKKRSHGDDDDDGDGDGGDEAEPQEPNLKAAKELKSLLEELMNATLESNQYITLPEGDSAAARFLVRSNIAVFHPRDARRVRLVEFWRSVED